MKNIGWIKISFLSFFIYGIVILVSCGPRPGGVDPATGYYLKAHEYFVKNEPQKAIPLYLKAIKKKQNYAAAYHEVAVCYQQIGNSDKAIEYFEGSIVFNARDVDAYQSIGDIFYVKGDNDQALNWFEKGSEVDFLYPRTYQNMATIWYQRGDLEKAKKYYEQAIAVDATYPRAYYGLGLLAYIQGDTAEAESKFQEAVKLGTVSEAMYMLGLLYFNKQQYDQASDWLNQYLAKEPAAEWSDKAKEMLGKIEEKKTGK